MESPLFCRACNKPCNSSKQFLEHKASPAHLAQEKKTQGFTLSNKGVLPAPASRVIEQVGSSFSPFLVSSGQDSGSNALSAPSAGMEDRRRAKSGPNGEPYVMNGPREYCYVCQIDLTSHDHCSQHTKGQKHEKKVQQLKWERTNVNSFMPRQPQVYASSICDHQLLPDNNPGGTRQQDGAFAVSQAFESRPISNLPVSDILQCKLCQVSISGEQCAREHFAGRKHKKQEYWLEIEKRKSFPDNFNSDPDQTKVLKVFSSSCNDPPPNIAMNTVTSEQHRSILATDKDPSVLGRISVDYGSNSSSVTNTEIPLVSDKKGQKLFGTCSENLTENYDFKTSLLGKKFDGLSLCSSSSNSTSISDNMLQLSTISNVPIDPTAGEVREHLASPAATTQRSFSLPSSAAITEQILDSPPPLVATTTTQESFSPPPPVDAMQRSFSLPSPAAITQRIFPLTSARPAIAPMESVSDTHCYRFDGNRGFCDACNISLTSRTHALQHLNGEKHKKKSRMFKIPLDNVRHDANNEGPLGTSTSESPLAVIKDFSNRKYYHFSGTTGYCYACKCDLSSPQQAEEHIKGRSHARHIEILHLNEQGQVPSLHCEACDVSLTGEVPASQHFSSEKHKRIAELLSCPAFSILGIEDARMIRDKIGVCWYFCDVCRKPLNTKEMLLIHQQSPGHKKEKYRKSESRDQVQGSSTAQVCHAAAEILEFSSGAERAHGDKGTLSESQRKMLTTAQNPVINVEPLASMRPHDQDNFHLNQPFAMPYSSGSVAKLQGNAGQERHDAHQQRADVDEANRHSSANVNFTNEAISQEASLSSPSSSQNMHQNSDADMRSQHDFRQNPTGQGHLEGSLDIMRKPQNSRRARGGDCIRNISMNEEHDPDVILEEDSKEKPTTVPNIIDAESFQQRRSPPVPQETTHKSIETREWPGFPYSCQLCQKPMNTKESYNAHINGNTHRWNVTYSKAGDIALGDISKNMNVSEREIFQRGYKVTKTFPRFYQTELMKKSMCQDSVIYLPTGTGKTLVSVMTMGLMLEDNFDRPVIFLVDKILLVIQQGRYIEEELEVKSKKYKRYSVNDRGIIKERLLNLAFVCGGMTHSQGIPLWKHDIIVTTAAYCYNMLEKGLIRWEHFSLAVFDEVHHCQKDHPYKKLISRYHTRIVDPGKRPKILGLSASPAGKDTVENTLQMLEKLLDTLGGARIAIPEDRSHDELKMYQSDPILCIFYVPLTTKEQDFQLECYKYFLRCYRKLAPMSSLCKSQESPLCNFNIVVNDHSEEALNSLAKNLLKDSEPLSEINSHVLSAKFNTSSHSEAYENIFYSLRMHIIKFMLSVSAIPTGVDFKEMEEIFEPSEDNHELDSVKSLGLPCDRMKQHIINFKDNEKGTISPMLDKLLMILQDTQYIDWEVRDPMALVLVRERKQAKNVSKKLKQTEFVRDRDLRVTHLVGHGKGANDAGMQVKHQKRVLDNHKDFHILVATSIAEEGIDIRKLGLVISMNPPSTVRALVQMRGRARLKDSHFVILCADEEEEKKLNKLIVQEKNMLEAAKRCLAREP